MFNQRIPDPITPAARATFVATTLCLAVLTGCMAASWNPDYLLPSNRRATVQEHAETYAQNLRWGRFNEAAQQVIEEKRRAFEERIGQANPAYRFTSAEVKSVKLGDVRSEVKVVVSYELYRPPSISERIVTETQLWRYVAEQRAWFVEPQLSVFDGESKSGVGSQ